MKVLLFLEMKILNLGFSLFRIPSPPVPEEVLQGHYIDCSQQVGSWNPFADGLYLVFFFV